MINSAAHREKLCNIAEQNMFDNHQLRVFLNKTSSSFSKTIYNRSSYPNPCIEILKRNSSKFEASRKASKVQK